MYVERKKLKIGEPISAPGAPKGYTYGTALVCPKCSHKTMVFRPRRKVWVCYHKDNYGVKCGFESMVYVSPRRALSSVPGHQSYYDELNGKVCTDLVVDLLGEELAEQHITEVCGDDVKGVKGRSGKSSSFLPYDSDRMRKYRQKYGLAGK